VQDCLNVLLADGFGAPDTSLQLQAAAVLVALSDWAQAHASNFGSVMLLTAHVL
jgi:hypothetical protein